MPRAKSHCCGQTSSARVSFANLGVSAFLLTLLLGAGVLIPGWVAFAQTRFDWPTSFEVTSVKPANPSDHGRDFRTSPSRLWFKNLPVKKLILFGYDLTSLQLEGLPSWASTRRYTIEAITPPAMAKNFENIRKLPPGQEKYALVEYRQDYLQMIQALLANRFKLRTHRMTKQLPVYDLVVAKGGPRLKPTNAADFIAAHRKPGSGEWSRSLAGYYSALGVSMAYFANGLSKFESGELGRIVINKTGLEGRYDFTLKWSPRIGGGSAMNFTSDSQMPAPPNHSGPSIFTAIKEQLGLKLKPAKGPVQALVVDHISPPTPN